MKRNSVPSAKFLNRIPCRTWASCNRKPLPTARKEDSSSPSGCGRGMHLELARKMIGRAENIEVPPFTEVPLGENLPTIGAILLDLVDRVAVAGDGPV